MSTAESTSPPPTQCNSFAVPSNPNREVESAVDATVTRDTMERELLEICMLSRKSRPTTFAALDWLLDEHACPLSSIRVAGIDRDILIPISKEDMLLLKEQAERAPFGFGPQTVLDQTVRDAWQVDGRNVWSVSEPSFFQRTVQTMILTSLKKNLGLDTHTMDVHATLYKMLLYEEGGHFLPHRDTEKEPGMFGTFLLQIPVEGGHDGGQLCIRHRGQEVTVDTSTQSTSTAFQEVMFYADCQHELKEVTRGKRCVLAFNLSWRATGADHTVGRKRKLSVNVVAGLPSEHTVALPELVDRADALIDCWSEHASDLKWASIPLDHKYTVENLSFNHLKGKDLLMARTFLAIPPSKLAMYLVLESITFFREVDSKGRNPLNMDESSKEILEEMEYVAVSLVSREGDVFFRYVDDQYCSKKNAYKLHTCLNRLGDGPVLDAYNLDEHRQGCEFTGNDSQAEERTYFRCLLLLAPKCFEAELLSILACKPKTIFPKIVNDGLKDSDRVTDKTKTV